MNKKAWNWTGSTDFEMGGNPTDNHIGTPERSNMLAINEPNSQNVVTTERADGITSPFQSDADNVLVDVVDENEKPIASFACNVASTYSDKILGLQKYNSLLETAGLLFPYSRPQDLIYHMGTVKFPIDIIFADDSNRIKKIYKNISPGTLGTFSCAGSKNVLEICGGLSDRLGLDVGNKIIINKYSNSNLEKFSNTYFNHHKKCIFKYSSFNKVNQWKEFPIVNISKDFKKIASINTDIKLPGKKILALDIDHTIFENGYINTFNVTSNFDGYTHNIFGDSVNVIDFDSVKHISEISDGFNILANNKSFNIFLNNEESKKLINKISKEKEIILLTRFENTDILKSALEYKLPNSNINVVKISEDYDLYNAINLLQNKFSKYDIDFYCDEQTIKLAGVPIPDDVKNYGKKVVKILLSIQEMVEESISNISKNMTEYDQHKDDPELIKNSKGQLFQSNRKNNQIVRTFLVKTRDAIRILNKIKDASTTLDIIEAMTISGKDVADHAEEVFDMIDQIDSPEFPMILMEKSKKYIKFSEDFNLTLKRAIDYINKDILGLIILSE